MLDRRDQICDQHLKFVTNKFRLLHPSPTSIQFVKFWVISETVANLWHWSDISDKIWNRIGWIFSKGVKMASNREGVTIKDRDLPVRDQRRVSYKQSI